MNELINVNNEMRDDFKKLLALGEELANKYEVEHFDMSFIKYHDGSIGSEANIYDIHIMSGKKDVGFFIHKILGKNNAVKVDFHKYEEADDGENE